MAAVGAATWALAGTGRGIGAERWGIILIAAAIGLLPPVRRAVAAVHQATGKPSPATRYVLAVCIAVAAAGYFIGTAANQNRDLFAKTNDDCSYLIGMQMLAHGRLWMPALPTPDFYDSFYILVKPVYCSIYFPGTALLYVPTIWLHLPTWVMPVLAAGAAVGLVYAIVAEMLDGFYALLAALMIVSLSWFRVYSILLTSHVPALLMGMAMVWCWLHWREKSAIGWAIAIGAVAGWAAITRPVDALVYALPVGAAMLPRLWKMPRRRAIGTVAAIIASAMPFLVVQGVFDLGVTGHLFRTPYSAYLAQDQPGSEFGFHRIDASARPVSPLIEKQEFFQWAKTYIAAHQPGNFLGTWIRKYLPLMIDTVMPSRLFLLLLPIGLLGFVDPPYSRVRVLLATLPLFVILYMLNPFFLEHYALLIIPATTAAILLGGKYLGEIWPPLSSAFALAIVAASLTGLWEINRYVAGPATHVSDETFTSPMLQFAQQWPQMQQIHKPAVVLFAYHPGGNFLIEPVYNTSTAWPLDAPVIRAHDLGRRNIEIFRYFAEHQPDRMFYEFDPTTGVLMPLGHASTLFLTAEETEEHGGNTLLPQMKGEGQR
ncbi:MAG TPA: hypothetical protein VHY37_13035 [Tepidisphaeraceae bacterium]|nr:hypothetical protein [Tepidisphaeraceae bacterium]